MVEERLDGSGLADRAELSAGAQAIQMLGYWLTCLGLSAWLATRRIGTTFDDANYLSHFRPFDLGTFDLIDFVLEEPGWRIITTFLGSVTNSYTAYQIVLFLGPLAFFAAMNKIIGGRWLRVGMHSWFVLTVFLFDHQIGSMHYIAAIRQGAAMSIFLLLTALAVPSPIARPFVPALVSATIHTANFVIAGAVAMAGLIRGQRKLVWFLGFVFAGYVVLLAFDIAPDPLGGVYLGRRGSTYTFYQALNLVGLALVAIQTGAILMLVSHARTRWFDTAVFFIPAALALALVNAGAARLFLTAHVLIAIIVGQALKSRRGIIAAGAWLASCIAVALWEGRKDVWGLSSWLGLWELTLLR